MSARNRELVTLLLAGLVASAAFASAWIQSTSAIDYGWVPWAALLGGVFVIAHIVTRATVPHADPTLLPLPDAASPSRSSALPLSSAPQSPAGWFTLDAGPNPVVLTDARSEPTVTALCRGLGADPVVPCSPGGDAALVA